MRAGWVKDPCAILSNYVRPGAITADGERVAPFRRPADVDVIFRALAMNDSHSADPARELRWPSRSGRCVARSSERRNGGDVNGEP